MEKNLLSDDDQSLSISHYKPSSFDGASLPHHDNPSSPAPYEPAQFDSGMSRQDAMKGSEPKEKDSKARVKAMEEAGFQKGYDEGFAKGYEKGIKGGEGEVIERAKRIEGCLRELEHFREKKLDELMPHIIELSMEIAKKIIHKEVELDRTVILHVARDAVGKVSEKDESIVIKVNPLDYEVMLGHIDSTKEQSGIKNIVIEPLTTITPGGCYIETQTGEIDARVEEQLKEVEDAIGTATDSEM